MKLRLLIFLFCFSAGLLGQDNTVKTVEDFDLSGRVNSCEIQTDYGTEFLVFNQDRSIHKISTVFNPTDKEEITFSYKNKEVSEKIIEVFRDNKLQKELSFYHKFSRKDTLLEEIILTLRGELIARNLLVVDSIGNTLKSVHESKDQQTMQIFERRLSAKTDSLLTYSDDRLVSLEVWKKNAQTKAIVEHMTVVFNDTVVSFTKHAFFDNQSLLIREVDSIFDDAVLNTALDRRYSYRNKRLITLQEIERNQSQTKRFIYQLDNSDPPNWVKRIEQPSNNYITRRITYYAENESIVK
jgi:hypothetical protein